MDSKSSNQMIKLNTSKEWKAWENLFKAKAIAKDLWEHINPECLEQPLFKKPTPPCISDFTKEVITTPQSTPEQQTQHGTVTVQASSASATQGTSTDTAGNRRPQPAVTIHDLSKDDRHTYQLLLSTYNSDAKRYEVQKHDTNALRDWVLETVSSQLTTTSCKPEESLRKWHDNLRTRVRMTTGQRQITVRTEYLKAVKPLTRAPRDFRLWLNNWTAAIDEAQDVDIQQATNPRMWCQDFMNAIGHIKPLWVATHEVHYRTAIEDETLDYCVVAKDFLDELVKEETEKKGTAAKGSFGPTFDGKDADAKSDNAQSSNTGANSKKRKYRHTGPCIVCKRRLCGNLATCYYANPDSAPSSWTPDTRSQEIAEKNLEKRFVKDKVAKAIASAKRLKQEAEKKD